MRRNDDGMVSSTCWWGSKAPSDFHASAGLRICGRPANMHESETSHSSRHIPHPQHFCHTVVVPTFRTSSRGRIKVRLLGKMRDSRLGEFSLSVPFYAHLKQARLIAVPKAALHSDDMHHGAGILGALPLELGLCASAPERAVCPTQKMPSSVSFERARPQHMDIKLRERPRHDGFDSGPQSFEFPSNQVKEDISGKLLAIEETAGLT